MKKVFLFILACVPAALQAQQIVEAEMNASHLARKKLAERSILKNYPARNIGPTVQGGRIVDLDVNLKNPKEFYVGYASGGVFKTSNNGITFEPIFDNNDALGVGDLVLSQLNTKPYTLALAKKTVAAPAMPGRVCIKPPMEGKLGPILG
jgi:hypothetical protein